MTEPAYGSRPAVNNSEREPVVPATPTAERVGDGQDATPPRNPRRVASPRADLASVEPRSRPDPPVRRDKTCAQCREPRRPVTRAMRRYAADQIDLDPFCCADCARAWYGTDARGHGSFIAYTQIPSGAPTRLRQEREAHAATRRAELSRAPIVETECAWCDVELPEELHGVRRFCSRECSRLWYNAYYDRRRAAA